MRRGPGLAALDRSAHSSAQYSSLGDALTTAQLDGLRSQLDTFASALRTFATNHRADIRKDPEFRHAFQRMCASIGVDPLGASARPTGGGRGVGKLAGMWNDLLGLGDWQYELGVQIIDVCVSTRHLNGGFIEMAELIRAVTTLRTGRSDVAPTRDRKGGGGAGKEDPGAITEEDIVRSIKTLKPLGCGYEVLTIGSRRMVRSVPRELDTDQAVIFALLASPAPSERDSLGLAFVTEQALLAPRPQLVASGLGPAGKPAWSAERARAVLDDMLLREGLLWVDEGAHPNRYYALGIMNEGLFTKF